MNKENLASLPKDFYQPNTVAQQALAQYPYLQKGNLEFLYSPRGTDNRKLEYWPKGESGSEQAKRPEQIPIDKAGIQILSSSVTPLDILGDYVSHQAVRDDPVLGKMYETFSQLVPEETLQAHYQWHQHNTGEKRPYEVWKEQTGLPEFFRGYTFNQFGENAQEMYTPEQLQVLDMIRAYLGIQ